MISWGEILIRLALAALFGGMVGVERERKNWTAGLRTHMMVCVGAALVMMVSAYGFADVLGTPNVVLDPSRMAAQVISGIGFIGAGTILFLRQEVIRGLTTASGLWTVAGIGLATGGGMYFAALVATVLVLIILLLLKPLEIKFFKRYKYQLIKILADNNEEVLHVINSLFEERGIAISNVAVEKKATESTLTIRFTHAKQDAIIINIISALNKFSFIKEISWNKGE